MDKQLRDVQKSVGVEDIRELLSNASTALKESACPLMDAASMESALHGKTVTVTRQSVMDVASNDTKLALKETSRDSF